MLRRLDAILPVTRADMPRARLLLRSLEGRLSCLGTLFIVVPEGHEQDVRTACSGSTIPIEVLPETAIVPELVWLGPIKGWYKQQLIKLAIADHVETDFYLTFDADVLCTRPATFEQLLRVERDGTAKAPVALLADTHPDWYQQAAAVLGMSPTRGGHLHSVTPAILARGGVRELATFLEDRLARGCYATGLRGAKQRLAAGALRAFGRERLRPWRLLLGASTPWTEYALYYTFLECAGSFDRYHFDTDVCIYNVEQSVWRADRDHFHRWDPAPLFVGAGPPFFVVVQSITRIPPAEVEAKIAKYL
ncbi:MAG: DUF6492 family protein [Myxococcales bacterium]|nr:DUF6492 family protein [Myxococcales bacterium]